MAAQTHPLPAPLARTPALPGTPSLPAASAPAPARRLLVLVPGLPLDEPGLARQAVLLAAPRALRIVFVGLAHAAAEEAALRRRLAGLAALARADQQPVDTLLSTDRQWLAAVRAVRQPGDEVACLAGQTTFGWGRRRPLAIALAAVLRVVVHELDGLALPVPIARRRTAVGAVAGFAALVGLFLWLQIQAVALPAGAIQGVFLIALVIAEFALIAAWDKLNR
jgi:hypothetical protein